MTQPSTVSATDIGDVSPNGFWRGTRRSNVIVSTKTDRHVKNSATSLNDLQDQAMQTVFHGDAINTLSMTTPRRNKDAVRAELHGLFWSVVARATALDMNLGDIAFDGLETR
jgi:hypothetical protein